MRTRNMVQSQHPTLQNVTIMIPSPSPAGEGNVHHTIFGKKYTSNQPTGMQAARCSDGRPSTPVPLLLRHAAAVCTLLLCSCSCCTHAEKRCLNLDTGPTNQGPRYSPPRYMAYMAMEIVCREVGGTCTALVAH